MGRVRLTGGKNNDTESEHGGTQGEKTYPHFPKKIQTTYIFVVLRGFYHIVMPSKDVDGIYEPRREKTGFLHMRKQRRRSASR